ncbi:uncharacterized protein LOC117087818 isoform X1 [Trachypithecus francoisi]|uniref:uncharacterized protein LOC117087818 isoform X1 n=1 Tax=Trachypithecus francoisi TaxID=54180 RepID=UPI00141AB740|nr:uncharacterized protein LOC117087818 isoform X1 [Trachypithecus francoisi]
MYPQEAQTHRAGASAGRGLCVRSHLRLQRDQPAPGPNAPSSCLTASSPLLAGNGPQLLLRHWGLLLLCQLLQVQRVQMHLVQEE